MALTVEGTYFDQTIGRGGDFALLRVGGKLYVAFVGNSQPGDQPGGNLFVGEFGKPLDKESLGAIAVGGALSVKLDAPPDGVLRAHIARLIDTGQGDQGRRALTIINTGIKVGGGTSPPPDPTPTPTPQPSDGLSGQVLAKLDALSADLATANKRLDDDYNAYFKPTKQGVDALAQAVADLARGLGDLPARIWDTPSVAPRKAGDPGALDYDQPHPWGLAKESWSLLLAQELVAIKEQDQGWQQTRILAIREAVRNMKAEGLI